MPERLQKILARHGLGSRREIERWIAEGRVTVNRLPAQIGAHYVPGDRVAIDGKEVTARLSIEVAPQGLLFHKAQGQPISNEMRPAVDVLADVPGDTVNAEDADARVRASDRNDLPTVQERLPAIRGSRWVPINLMHAGDSGLLLLTNDGNLGYALTRRKRWIPCSYLVRVLAPDVESPPELPLQVTYDSGHGNQTVEFTSVEPAGGEGSNVWYRVEVPRADHRAAVRALFESRDMKVSRMTQVGFGGIELPRDLPRGRHRALTPVQMAMLYDLAQLKMPEAPPPIAAIPQRKSRGLAPDRRAAKKKASSREGTRDVEKAARFADHREEKFADKRKRAAKQKKPSTFRVGGKKRPQGDSRR